MPWWKALLLGVVQGLTEFLPVSSSGHLVLFQKLLRADLPGISFEIAAHLGTLVAVAAVYRQELAQMWRGAACLVCRPAAAARHPGARLLALVAVGTLPAALVALLLGDAVEAAFDRPRGLGVSFLLTGTLLWLAARAQERPQPVDERRFGFGQALLVGLFQALAVLPGVSRSGSTVTGGLLLGLEPELAARFSFLLFVPAVLGAALLDAVAVARGEPMPPLGPLLLGFAAAALSGYGAIRFFLRALRARRLMAFAWYTWALGALLLAFGRGLA